MASRQGRSPITVYQGVAGMIPTARVQRRSSETARCASKEIILATPLHFSASC